MKGLLIRVGVDHSYGKWNSPVDLPSGDFVYVPIPDAKGKRYRNGCKRRYQEVLPALRRFGDKFGRDLQQDLGFPRELLKRCMHLDPDFEFHTYGDKGDARGASLKTLGEGDLLVFYAGLRAIQSRKHLVYGLVGLYVVNEVVPAIKIPRSQWKENAHTRWFPVSDKDVIVRAKHGFSGRLERCIPIGEWRNRAYRVREDVLEAWGELSVKDGYIQRSARLPCFLNPDKFYGWFLKQDIRLVRRNN